MTMHVVAGGTNQSEARILMMGGFPQSCVAEERGGEHSRAPSAVPLCPDKSLPRQPEAVGPGTPYSPHTTGTFEYS